ncbi:MAG TPA: methylated-DNA--[protein]-cysteine S-methyltransferase [Firmicutes bacterium]|nr:methylated-DNA--[protein]-cysteine S-methyltransferase [Bacillota bacterium]
MAAEVEEAARRDGRAIDLTRDAEAAAEVRRQVEAYSTDPAAPLGSPLDLAGLSESARAVAEALRTVPPGRTVTYGELAAKAGRPGGARAIGQAMRRNRLPLFVPCHRVVARGGGLGGFSGGLVQKLRSARP